jgi:hypothetical protein
MLPDVACLARSRPFVVRGVFLCSLKRITLSGRGFTQGFPSLSLPALSATISYGPGVSVSVSRVYSSPGPKGSCSLSR